MQEPVVVIGAGAAGVIAAWSAATHGAKVVLLEKTDRIGTKILISGGGKCNITHDGPIESVLKSFRPNEARFIRPACYRFLNTQIIDMLTDRGLRVYTRPDGRIFPVDQTAKDVVRILRSYLDEAGVETRLLTPVRDILAPGGQVRAVQAEDDTIPTRHVILCTGGSSYPRSGTTGDGWPWARRLGHTIVPVIAALAPMNILLDPARGRTPGDRAGVALRDIVLRGRLDGKETVRWRGDLLFTHHGVSGPCALGVSREIAEAFHEGDHTLEADLLPDEKFDSIAETLRQSKAKQPNRQANWLVDGLLPASLEPDLLADAAIDPAAKLQSLSKKQLNKLTELIKGWPLGVVREVILDKGEVVAGGVALDEVDPHTLRSHKCHGLYLAGEVLDIAGPVGGYNLQAAWATGYVAGETAAHDWRATLTPGEKLSYLTKNIEEL